MSRLVPSTQAIAQLEPSITNEHGDRHVLAAALETGRRCTYSQPKTLSPEACEPHSVDAIRPDDFLVNLCDLDPSYRPARALSAQLARPKVPMEELLAMLQKRAFLRSLNGYERTLERLRR